MRLKIILWDELHESKIYELQDFCPVRVREQKVRQTSRLSAARILPDGFSSPCRGKKAGNNSISK